MAIFHLVAWIWVAFSVAIGKCPDPGCNGKLKWQKAVVKFRACQGAGLYWERYRFLGCTECKWGHPQKE